jgi:hypothetical protein
MALFGIVARHGVPARATFFGDDKVDVREAPGKGRGVFATRAIECGELIELTAVLLFDARELELLNQTRLGDYLVHWPVDPVADECLPLGRICLANHSEEPNTEYHRDLDQGIIEWVALRRIESGEELTFKYHCVPWFPIR